MRVLITGGGSRLAQAISEVLQIEHQVRLLERVAIESSSAECLQGDILNAGDCEEVVRGMDAVIHACEPPPDLPPAGLEREQQLLDLATRGTHTLIRTAIGAGVRRFVCAGSLEIFRTYPEDVYLTEMWKPLPSSEILPMSKYLGEVTAREFARDYRATVTCLRLGELVLEEEVENEPANPMWVDLRDAAEAFRLALRRDQSEQIRWTRRWGVYHICADIPNPWFLIDHARRLGYQPAHNFTRHYQEEETR